MKDAGFFGVTEKTEGFFWIAKKRLREQNRAELHVEDPSRAELDDPSGAELQDPSGAELQDPKGTNPEDSKGADGHPTLVLRRSMRSNACCHSNPFREPRTATTSSTSTISAGLQLPLYCTSLLILNLVVDNFQFSGEVCD